MRHLTLIVLMVVLVGCVQEDPWRAALANERQVQAANSQAATQANIERAQQADTDARNAQAMLLALQSQQAIVQGQAAQAQAMAQVETVRVMAEAKRSDNTLAIVVVIVAGLVCGVWIVTKQRVNPAVPVGPKLLYSSARYEAWLLPDNTVEYHRLTDGQVRVLEAKRDATN